MASSFIGDTVCDNEYGLARRRRVFAGARPCRSSESHAPENHKPDQHLSVIKK